VKIEEYLASLPPSIISGEDVQLLDETIKEIFRFVKLGENDVFYHLGCGAGNSLVIAEKFGVKRAVGIDKDETKISEAKKLVKEKNLKNTELRCQDIVDSELSDATVILFWFSDTKIVEKMLGGFSKLKTGTRIVTIFDPLPKTLPSKVSFPYIIHQVPFKQVKDLKEQIMAVFETECIDFTTAWEFAERYTKAIGSPDSGNDRFLTILQALTIWINARNLGLSCTQEIPPAVKSYIEILQNFFNIEVKHLLK
jgi:SAM-dependent methyltransferase